MNTTFKQVLAYCQVQKINLSAQQELILMIISQATSAVSSHEILTNLIQHNPKANRMTIHRALDLLIKANLISFSFNSLCFFLDSKVLNTFAFVMNLNEILNKDSYTMVTLFIKY